MQGNGDSSAQTTKKVIVAEAVEMLDQMSYNRRIRGAL